MLDRLKILKFIQKNKNFIFLLLLVIISIFIGNFIFNILIKTPYIAIIKIDGSLTTEFKKDEILKLINDAEENRSIKAVVLEINSPGGEASIVEEIYFSLLDLRRKKPIVASIDQLGASGAYYIAVASNYIYAKPSSDIGSVGAISVLPKREPLDENTITTGPLKGIGTPRKEQATQLQMIQESFLRAVLTQRGNNLKVGREELAKAKVYIGFEALNLGLIDALGTSEDAIKKASKLAHIANYKVVELNREIPLILVISLSVEQSVLNSSTNTVPINYYLYINQKK